MLLDGILIAIRYSCERVYIFACLITYYSNVWSVEMFAATENLRLRYQLTTVDMQNITLVNRIIENLVQITVLD